MKKIRWNLDKSLELQSNPNRGVSLELLADLIQAGAVVGTEERPRYPDQKAFVVLVGEEVWCVPFRVPNPLTNLKPPGWKTLPKTAPKLI